MVAPLQGAFYGIILFFFRCLARTGPWKCTYLLMELA